METLLQWKSNKYYIFWVCVCSHGHSAWNVHAPYCHLWPAWLHNIFLLYLINSTIFDKNFLNIKCVCWFSPQLMAETFLILRRTEWDKIKNVYWSSCIVPLFMAYFNETWTSSTNFWKILKYQISWKSIQWKPSCSKQKGRQTYGHDEDAFHNFTNMCKNHKNSIKNKI